MPNHVLNELIFRGVQDADADRILAQIVNDEGKVDFERLVPMPLNMWWGNVGSQHEKAFGNTSLDWARQNWGTKWNAYESEPVERVNDVLAIRFQTAWSPPYPWLAAVFNKLDLSFDHNWLNEGMERGVCGHFKRDGKMGIEWFEQPAPDYMQRHLHKMLWGVEEFVEDPA